MRFSNSKNQVLIVLGTLVGFVICLFLVIRYVPNKWIDNIKEHKLLQQIREIAKIEEYKNKKALKECLEKATSNERVSYVELNSSSTPQEGYPNSRRWNSEMIVDTEGQNTGKDAASVCKELYSGK